MHWRSYNEEFKFEDTFPQYSQQTIELSVDFTTGFSSKQAAGTQKLKGIFTTIHKNVDPTQNRKGKSD